MRLWQRYMRGLVVVGAVTLLILTFIIPVSAVQALLQAGGSVLHVGGGVSGCCRARARAARGVACPTGTLPILCPASTAACSMCRALVCPCNPPFARSS